MIRLLASVRDVAEALAAARGGADFIDLKEPGAGALGGLPTLTIRAIVAALRRTHPQLPISATIGDHDCHDGGLIAARVEEVGACGVDYVKVGIAGEGAAALLGRLAAGRRAVVPVFIADAGLDLAAVEAAARLPFPGLMADTEDKLAGSLFDCVPPDVLAAFVAIARRAGKLAGLAGALRERHVPALLELAPDFAGFRSALCAGDRAAELVPDKLRRLRLSFGA